MPGCLCNLRSQSYYFTTCLVVIISLRAEISDVSIAHYICLPFLPLLLIIRSTVIKANILKMGLVRMITLLYNNGILSLSRSLSLSCVWMCVHMHICARVCS